MKLSKEYNLLVVCPEICKEWDYEKNELGPENIYPNSRRKIWWKCEKGHEWKQSPNNRNYNGCPYCSNMKICKDNCLSTLNPKLAKEWNYERNGVLTPEMVGVCSYKKVWWKCSKNHEWKSQISSRNLGVNCPCCANKKVCKDNCLATINPELIKEWNYEKNGNLTPYDIIAGSHKKVWWICEKGHEWECSLINKTINSCPYCSNHRVCSDNCLAMINSELAKEWNYRKNGNLTPNDILPNSSKKVWWICEKGHEWIADPHHRNNGRGCPKCAKRISKGCKIWLDGLKIKSREKHVKIGNINYYADGFVKSTNTIYEFLGDFYHGNPMIFSPNKINKITKTSYFELLCKTITKLNNYYSNEYNIIYKWEGLDKEYEYKFINANSNLILERANYIFVNNRKENIFELLVSIGE